MKLAFVILAAGKGTRMESDLAKVLHPLCGRPLLAWVLETARVLEPQRVVAVVGHQAEAVMEAVRPNYPTTEFALQSEMLGTGHAVQQAESVLRDFDGDIIVTCGDAPLISAETFRALAQSRRDAGAAASMLVSTLDDPGSYGRVIRQDGRVSKIVEAKDASEEERACRDVNAGTYCFRSDALWEQLNRIDSNNKSGEFYLTDVIGLLNRAGETVVSVDVGEREMTGVNTKAQLAALEAELQAEGVGSNV
jgi:UDP-N-acetylglucosamine diphosphorylase/glucosamine-1-phosphate N-acetyltransferase